MTSLLHRALSDAEEGVQTEIRKALEGLPATHTGNLTRVLRRSGARLFFAAALSLVEAPPASGIQRRLCGFLIETPGFLVYIGNPDHFERADLVQICKVLIKVVPRLDVHFVGALSELKESAEALHNPTFLRVLDVLDELSPGGRLVMALTRLLRDLEPALESKAVLSLARRVQNPAAISRQLHSSDSRVRANCVEALWGSNTQAVRKLFLERLADEDNRVVGNALVGLSLAGDPHYAAHLIDMLREKRGPFRRTAAWVMGKIGDPRFHQPLLQALGDEDSSVRAAVQRALERYPQTSTARASEAAESVSDGELEWGAIWPKARA